MATEDRSRPTWDAPLPIWILRGDVVQAAIDYEEAWTAYAHRPQTAPHTREECTETDLILAKGHAHQALLTAVRALKERHG